MNSTQGKRFKARWGEGYTNQGTREVGEDHFTNDNGYTESDIREVMSLPIGGEHDMTMVRSVHYVTRVR